MVYLDFLSFLCDRCELDIRDLSAFQLAYSWKYISLYSFTITHIKGKMFGMFPADGLDGLLVPGASFIYLKVKKRKIFN